MKNSNDKIEIKIDGKDIKDKAREVAKNTGDKAKSMANHAQNKAKELKQKYDEQPPESQEKIKKSIISIAAAIGALLILKKIFGHKKD